MAACDEFRKTIAGLNMQIGTKLVWMFVSIVWSPEDLPTLRQEVHHLEAARAEARRGLLDCLAYDRWIFTPHAVKVDHDVHHIQRACGEAQSTVIAPGTPGCEAGRILISIDTLLPTPFQDTSPPTGTVVYRDLDNLDALEEEATFASVPSWAGPFWYLSNDHDLVSLSNGNVLLLAGLGSRAPLSPKPKWWDSAYRYDAQGKPTTFGPGARSVVHVWLSSDAGKSFVLQSVMDPATIGDGSGALPQLPAYFLDPTNTSANAPRDYLMGGSDGQLARVDSATDDVYVTFQFVGSQPDSSVKWFQLSKTPLNMTLVAKLQKPLVTPEPDSKLAWTGLGLLEQNVWRMGIVPLEGGKLACGGGFKPLDGSTRIYVQPSGGFGTVDVPTTGTPAPVAGSWESASFKSDKTNPFIASNAWAHPILARAGEPNGLVLAVPHSLTVEGDHKTNGYEVYLYDIDKSEFTEVDPIRPVTPDTQNVAMHLTAIDLGSGPVLFYWLDVDFVEQTVGVFGRLVGGNAADSPDFEISRADNESRRFLLDPGPDTVLPYWYGDYFTAGGYVHTTFSGVEYHYYPIWVEPDSTVRFTHVQFTDYHHSDSRKAGPTSEKDPYVQGQIFAAHLSATVIEGGRWLISRLISPSAGKR